MYSSNVTVDKGKNATSGFYIVGDRIFTDKMLAFYHGSINRKWVYWNFHDDVFGNFKWQATPTKTLAEVYRERAQQLRDTYDYISISFSGGADSWNVLNSFLSNGIHVDEIYTRFAISGTRKHLQANNTDRSSYNYTSEYEYAVKPVLEYVQKNFPKTKITVDDITDSYYTEVTESELHRAGHFAFNGMSAKRCANQIGLDVDFQNKKVASIRGSGKIHFYKRESGYYISFVDTEAWPADADPHLTVEYFYWTPDMPEVVHTQAHAVLNFFQARPDLNHLLTRKKNLLANADLLDRYESEDLSDFYIYSELIKEICYPEWDMTTFQTKKNSGSVYQREEDFWILQENSKSVQSWRWALDQYANQFAPAAFITKNNQKFLKYCESKEYKIG